MWNQLQTFRPDNVYVVVEVNIGQGMGEATIGEMQGNFPLIRSLKSRSRSTNGGGGTQPTVESMASSIRFNSSNRAGDYGRAFGGRAISREQIIVSCRKSTCK